ncbi:hypothetical protein J3Q64DRAFT_1184266 [Phycomyces blakesleeanus]|uniref:Dolichyl-P-Glc:Glc(2)Man(9)GlcNAc(2)-PP-dolichol alpha-1,2-glucosyltransferase n=1 Tax=Phycomyces blakesleeanus TaxID=4837 RepID=A0ABR3ASK5_PHYBL
MSDYTLLIYISSPFCYFWHYFSLSVVWYRVERLVYNKYYSEPRNFLIPVSSLYLSLSLFLLFLVLPMYSILSAKEYPEQKGKISINSDHLWKLNLHVIHQYYAFSQA